MIKVVNKKYYNGKGIYIGRGSPHGNRYASKYSKYTDIIRVASKEEAISKFEDDLKSRPDYKEYLAQFKKDDVLICFCAPPGGCTHKDGLCCHGQVIALHYHLLYGD